MLYELFEFKLYFFIIISYFTDIITEPVIFWERIKKGCKSEKKNEHT